MEIRRPRRAPSLHRRALARTDYFACSAISSALVVV